MQVVIYTYRMKDVHPILSFGLVIVSSAVMCVLHIRRLQQMVILYRIAVLAIVVMEKLHQV